MIYELLSTALLACSLSAGNYKDEPKRAVSQSYLGTYTITSSIGNAGDHFSITSPNGETATINRSAWGVSQNVTTSDGYATLYAECDHNADWSKLWASIVLKLPSNNDDKRERIAESYQFMQEGHFFSIGSQYEVDEFNYEYEPEISLVFTWGGTVTEYTSSCTFTFPQVYKVSYETFGTMESNGVSWVKQNDRFSKTFNAIYVDNTEPKLYAFWIDTHMLARQVRFNGDIINQNYVTTLDGLDPSFGKQCSIHFTPTEDVELKVSAVPYDPTWSLTNDYNKGYNNGYEAGKTEGQQPVSWIKTTFDGIAGFFNIQVFPFVTLGFLCFAPLIVVAIVAILRIIKHD